MINVVDKYFNYNRTLLLMIGLWPYGKSKCVGIQIICMFFIIISGIIVQLATFFTSKCTPDFIVKVLCMVFSFGIVITKYFTIYVNHETMKYFIRQLQHIYNNLRDQDEIAIVERYGSKAKQYTLRLTILIATASIISFAILFWRDISDIILSPNLSHSRHQLPIDTEYFIDEEKYFYLIYFHLISLMAVGVIVVLATKTIIITYVIHACGLFKIASYRIERAIKVCNSTSKNIRMQNQTLAHNDIVRAVDIHRKAMTFSTDMATKFEKPFLLLIVLGVLMLSLNVFRISQIIFLNFNIEEVMVNIVAAGYCFLYMFMVNFVGQQVIDHNNNIFITAYKVQWYKTSLHIQRLILFLLQRGSKSFGLCVGKLFVGSIECFAMLFNTSISYFTLMYSMQQ